MARQLDFPVFDADTHLYEAEELVGIENVCFGSDYPHPEGMYDPLTYVDEIASLSTADQAKVMGGNLARIMRVAP